MLYFKKEQLKKSKDSADLVQTIIIVAGLAVASIVGIGAIATTTMGKGHETANCIANKSFFDRSTDFENGCEGENGNVPDDSPDWKVAYSNDTTVPEEKIYVSSLNLSMDEQDEILNAVNNKMMEIMFRDYTEEQLMSMTPDEVDATIKIIKPEALNAIIAENSMNINQQIALKLNKECSSYGGEMNYYPVYDSYYSDDKATMECAVNMGAI